MQYVDRPISLSLHSSIEHGVLDRDISAKRRTARTQKSSFVVGGDSLVPQFPI
jgi:hypothetical protein